METAPNVVEVYVGYLRRKIGRGRGWRPCAAPATGWRPTAADRRRLTPVAAAGARPARPGCWLIGGRSALARRAGRSAAVACWSARSATRCSARSTPRRSAPPTRRRRAGRRRTRCPTRCRWPAGRSVQVVDAQGRVRAASTDADRLVPMLHARRAGAARDGRARWSSPGDRVGLTGPLRVVAVPAGPPATRRPCWSARSIGRRPARASHVLRTVLLVGVPAAGAGAGRGGLAGDRRDAAPGRGAAPRAPRRSPAAAAAGRLPVPARATRSTGWP